MAGQRRVVEGDLGVEADEPLDRDALCAVLANDGERVDLNEVGVVAAAKNLNMSVPIVARLEGTNVEEGRRVLRESGINIQTAEGMRDAAEKVVAAAG